MRLQHPGGWSLDRIPAWAKWATVAPGQMGAKFDGIYWDLPPEERHQWCACVAPASSVCPRAAVSSQHSARLGRATRS